MKRLQFLNGSCKISVKTLHLNHMLIASFQSHSKAFKSLVPQIHSGLTEAKYTYEPNCKSHVLTYSIN